MNLEALHTDQLISLKDDILASIEELEAQHYRIKYELETRDEIGPTLWETYTPEERQARRTAMENMIQDKYVPAMRNALNREMSLLSALDGKAGSVGEPVITVQPVSSAQLD